VNIDMTKARHFLAAGEDRREIDRNMYARFAEARVEAQLRRGRVCGTSAQLWSVPLAEMVEWGADELFALGITRTSVLEAIEAQDYAEDLRARLDAAVAISAPTHRLAARVREFLHQHGFSA
jgi:hypothetical protein